MATKIDIISGFLGAGKTTLIKKLLKEAYADEQVVLIENEFGEIGIDGGFLKEAGIQIREMNSGCICCSLVGDFGTSRLKMCTGSETLHCHIVSDPVYLICSEFSCLYFINSLMISLIISSSSGVSIPLKWLPAAAVWRILSAICSTISSFTASSAFSGTGTSSTHVRACST